MSTPDSYNPLLAKPMVSGLLDDLVVPVVGQVIGDQPSRGPITRTFGAIVSQTMADLFEQKVGRQLTTIPNTQLYPETSTTTENDQSTGSSSATKPSSWSK